MILLINKNKTNNKKKKKKLRKIGIKKYSITNLK